VRIDVCRYVKKEFREEMKGEKSDWKPKKIFFFERWWRRRRFRRRSIIIEEKN